MEKIKSETNCTSRDELTIDELNHVSGGSLNYGHIEYTSSTSTPTKPGVWVGCAWVPQWW